MLSLDCIQGLLRGSFGLLAAEINFIHPATSLPFNPIKLIFLVIWVYLCIYLIQYMQFSPLVPKKYKFIAYIITLLSGPLLFLILFIIDTAKKSRKSNKNIFKTAIKQLKSSITKIRSRSHIRQKEDGIIKLLDPLGRNINEIYGHGDHERQDSHILNLTEKIIADALERRASDILIDPKDESTYTIRLRVDGVLRTVQKLKAETCRAVVNSIKAVSNMDISEKRRPQDGAFSAKQGGKTASFR
ncbi:MAG: Flp pilus assembly complex ATPase component TadA, partial [Sedimentisphaerales bacterium]|nr:Flp pilus assembly complex ATPase component TadA [Sedimentisphaerales bacterium]